MVSFARINPAPLTTHGRLGRTLTSTDQRGVVHTYSYDTACRARRGKSRMSPFSPKFQGHQYP
jgi:hypothetical protein